MFRASSCPSSGATTAVAASGLTSELGDSSAVGRGRGRAGRPARPRPTALLPPIRTDGCYTGKWIYLRIFFIFKFLFGTLTNKCTIISQIITLPHVSTLSCHPQEAYNQYLAKLHKYFKCSCW